MLRQPLYDSEITDTHASAEYPMGDLREYNHPTYGYQIYRYVKNTSGGALAAGLGVQQEEDDPWNVELWANAAPKAACVGVAQHAIADTYHGWVLVDGIGLGTTEASTTSATAETPLQAEGAGCISDGTVGTHSIVGYALAAIATGSNTGLVRWSLL
jgi:hypothetical protein